MGGSTMSAKEYWKIDNNKIQTSHIIAGMDDLKNFSFEVIRLKDIYSYEEEVHMITFTLVNESKQISFSSEDMDYLNRNEKGVIFEEIPCNTLIPHDMIIVLIEISNNIGMATLYDLLKYSFSYLLGFVQKKLLPKKAKTVFKIKKDGKEFDCFLSFDLNEEQKQEIVDAVVEELKNW